MQNRTKLRKALKSCTYGDLNAKNYVKSYIRDLLINRYKIDEMNICRIINFDNPKSLLPEDMFDILLYQYKQKHQYSALEHLIIENNMDQPKQTEDGPCYKITDDEIKDAYFKHVGRLKSFEARLEIIVQRIYQQYKGYGVIDEIRDMKIDGVSGGVSGIIDSHYEEMGMQQGGAHIKSLPFSYDSVWIFFKGKTMHLPFLSFKTKSELIRICKNIYRYNNPGQLSESVGYKVNEMADGSRVVVARPPFSESWVFFLRKFNSVKQVSIEELIKDESSQLPIELIKWLIKGCRITAITGSQGTGKTTLLMSVIKFINAAFTLRIQEMAFELNLRKIYPERNIVTFRETAYISGQEGLDLQKKTEGTVNILGEVATAPVSSYMIQVAQVASLFTLFTHHAKTTENLIYSLRNNLLQTGVFSNERIAEEQVAEVINFDIHLNKSVAGHRYIERITEVIPQSHYREYPTDYRFKASESDQTRAFMDTMETYFERVTDRKTFITRDIIRYENGRYIMVNPLTEESQKEMMKHLSTEEALQFQSFLIGGQYEF